MIELEKKFKEKLELLNNFKRMFYRDKKHFKEYLAEFSINDQARMFAFFMANDMEFYKEVNDYTGGICIDRYMKGKQK